MSYKTILSINSGSSSVKFSLFKIPAGAVNNKPSKKPLSISSFERLLSGSVEEIGTRFGQYRFESTMGKKTGSGKFENHSVALTFIIDNLNILLTSGNGPAKAEGKPGSFGDLKIDVVAHRFVHGGSSFKKPVIVNQAVLKKLRPLNELAPLHNPSNLKGLEFMSKYLPLAKQVCIFDTAYHRTIPLYARIYPIPIEYYRTLHIEKFGFHGISYSYISNLLKNKIKKFKKYIICHLGNGSSICAVNQGNSVDTSMGYTPLEGLMMGTRCGSIDPSIPFILQEKLKTNSKDIYNILNKKSGLLGISEKTYDFKELEGYKDKGSRLALKMFSYSIIKHVGQFSAVLNGIDGLVFSGGIGENSALLRNEVCKNLSYLGIKLDEEKNKKAAEHFKKLGGPGKVGINESIQQIGYGKTPVMVVHTDEELHMALESINICRPE